MELRSPRGHVWRLHTGDEPGWLIRWAIMDQHLRDLASGWATVRYGCMLAGLEAEPGSPLRLPPRCSAASGPATPWRAT